MNFRKSIIFILSFFAITVQSYANYEIEHFFATNGTGGCCTTTGGLSGIQWTQSFTTIGAGRVNRLIVDNFTISDLPSATINVTMAGGINGTQTFNITSVPLGAANNNGDFQYHSFDIPDYEVAANATVSFSMSTPFAVYTNGNSYSGGSISGAGILSGRDALFKIYIEEEMPNIINDISINCVPDGGNLVLRADATGYGPLTYDWEVNTGSGFGPLGTGNPFVVSNISAGDNGNMYRVKVSNSSGMVTSNNATLTVPTGTFMSVGDLAFTGFHGDTEDKFSFVLLKNIPADVTINFTDKGWRGDLGFNTSETILAWSHDQPLDCGTEITIRDNGSSLEVASIGTVTFVTGTSTDLSLGSSGDQMIAFMNTAACPIFIAGLTDNNDIFDTDTETLWDIDPGTSSSKSILPPGLINGETAISLYPGSYEFDNGTYDGSNATGTVDVLRASMNNRSNWVGTDAAFSNANFPANPAITYAPTGCATLSGGVQIVCPTVGAVSASETTVEINDPFNITATGLVTMDVATNMDQNYGVSFVFFGSATSDPYSGGASLGTVAFGSLTGGATTASLVGATIATADPTGFIYAILSPTPADGTCRPSAVTTISVIDNGSITITNCPTTLADGVVGLTCLNATPNYIVFPTFTTTCPTSSIVTVVQTPPAGTQLGVGMHPVVLTATDQCGNEETCSFTLNNTDITAPIMNCPATFTINLVNGVADITADTLNTITANTTDNCGAFTVSGALLSLTCADEGTFNYTVTATDQYMNANTCDVTIEVIGCTCTSGDNMFIGTDGIWDDIANWSEGCIPASPYVGTLTIMDNVNTMTFAGFVLTGDLIVQNGATFDHNNGSTFAVDGNISVLAGGSLKNTSTLSTTGGLTNDGTYSGNGIDGNFTNNGTFIIGGN